MGRLCLSFEDLCKKSQLGFVICDAIFYAFRYNMDDMYNWSVDESAGFFLKKQGS